MNVAGALLYGFANLLHPRMLWLMVWPMLVSLVFWGAVAAAFWERLAAALAALFQRWLEPAAGFLHLDLGGATVVAAYVVLVLLLVPLVYLTALFILGAFGMQKMVDHVAQRSFPALERRRGGGVAGSVWNGVAALGGMALLFLISLPLWLLPPLWPLIPLAIFTWANQKLLRYDALGEHADAAEMARLFRERRGALLTLGLLFALLAYVPFVGFIAPVLFGLAFIRYLLGALQELRRAAVD
jgi:CysZ protein